MNLDIANEVERVGILVTSDILETEIDEHNYLVLNSSEGHMGLISRLRARGDNLRIVCEECKGYEKPLVSRLQREGFEVAVVGAIELRIAAEMDKTEITPRFLAELAAQLPSGRAQSKSSPVPIAQRLLVSDGNHRRSGVSRMIEGIAAWIFRR